jgi:hypothetical protein
MRRQRRRFAAFRVVDAHEPVVLHQNVPDVPGEDKDDQTMQSSQIEPQRR